MQAMLWSYLAYLSASRKSECWNEVQMHVLGVVPVRALNLILNRITGSEQILLVTAEQLQGPRDKKVASPSRD